jgi:hypothetical protein
MTCLLPLLKFVKMLMTFSQKRDVFLCDFVIGMKVCLIVSPIQWPISVMHSKIFKTLCKHEIISKG